MKILIVDLEAYEGLTEAQAADAAYEMEFPKFFDAKGTQTKVALAATVHEVANLTAKCLRYSENIGVYLVEGRGTHGYRVQVISQVALDEDGYRLDTLAIQKEPARKPFKISLHSNQTGHVDWDCEDFDLENEPEQFENELDEWLGTLGLALDFNDDYYSTSIIKALVNEKSYIVLPFDETSDVTIDFKYQQ